MNFKLFTIGHSTHPIDYFIELLSHYSVNCVVDVRSVAASRFNPQYNKKALANSLKDHGIVYLHFGEEFGARRSDPDVLDDEGRVDFQKVRDSEKFAKGVDRIFKGAEDGYIIALMCSEADPLSCHRFSMISVALKDFEILHILKDKSIITQGELEDKLMNQYAGKLPKRDIFNSTTRDEQLTHAYKLLNKSVAYSPVAHAKGFRK